MSDTEPWPPLRRRKRTGKASRRAVGGARAGSRVSARSSDDLVSDTGTWPGSGRLIGTTPLGGALGAIATCFAHELLEEL